MSKRIGNFNVGNGKKPKLDEDDFDDDFDEDAIEKCFELASQVCEQQNIIVSTQNNDLPSYSFFQKQNSLVSSTQMKLNCANDGLSELKAEISKLRLENKEKTGEISILRDKVKETKTALEIENEKAKKEWKEKLVTKQKEVNVLKSDLEFKNLAIANLKQQISELKRHNNLEATQNFTQPVTVSKDKPQQSKSNQAQDKTPSGNKKNEVLLESAYPLRTEVLRQILHNFDKEKHVMNSDVVKLSRNTLPYLQNQLIYKDWNFRHKCVDFKSSIVKLDEFYGDMVKLANKTSEQLNSSESDETVDKILCITFILLQDLEDYLIELSSTFKAEDVQEIDTNYLQNKNSNIEGDFLTEDFDKDELGMKCGKMIAFLSEILPHSDHLMNCICHQKPIKFQSKTEYQSLSKYDGNNFILLNVILNIIKIIGKYRKADIVTCFLCSVTRLLTSIYRSKRFEVVNDLCCQIFCEIVFSRPPVEVVYRLTFFIKVASKFRNFIKFLLGKADKKPLQADTKGVLYYTEGACPFCVFSILFQNTLLKMPNVPVSTCFNMLSFIYNTFNVAYWIHHDNTSVCSCLSQLYKIQIEIVYVVMENYVKDFKEKKKIGDDYGKLIKHKIIEKVLNLMAFNNYEFTEKYVIIYAQFKEIERILGSKAQFAEAKLNATEEVLQIPETQFVNINF